MLGTWGQARWGRGAPCTAGSRVTPECRGAWVEKLPGELKPEGVSVLVPRSGLKVRCCASMNAAISISMFLLVGVGGELGRIRRWGEIERREYLDQDCEAPCFWRAAKDHFGDTYCQGAPSF